MIHYITYAAGNLKKPIPFEKLLPDYLDARDEKKIVEKSIEQQRAEFADFMNRYNAAKEYAKGLKS